MKLVIDANILLSAILGSANRLGQAIDRGADTVVVDAQLAEARNVLLRFDMPAHAVEEVLAHAVSGTHIVTIDDVAAEEDIARARLHDRGQRDWPVLAAALALDADVWSDDRDFFGVGVPVWSTRNISHAIPPRSQ